MANQLKEEIILSTEHFDQKIDDVIKKVNKLQSQGNKAGNSFSKSMGNMISKATGFNGSLTSILGVAGKLSGVLGGITAGINLADWFSNSVKEGVRLAEAGEGIRLAFDRLNKGNLLAKLREETHNTVTDIELMKQAVKFNDFNLDVEQMGKMLAYAQLKAKDTGESIDYMVNSITTGLGRKSLPILDNLGLSAAEIKEEMAKGGDMVTAVTKIIEKRMKEAGDYVETAADRAAQANVSLQNKMEELGRKFAPLEEASNNFWTSMKIAILDVVGGPLANLLNKLTEAGRLMNAYGQMGGNPKVNRMIANLAGARQENRQSIYNQQQMEFWKYINPREQQLKDIRSWQRGERSEALQKRISAITKKYGSLDATKIQAEVDAAKKMQAEYQSKAQNILKTNSNSPTTTPTGTTTTTTTTSSEKNKVYAEGSLGWYQQKISELQDKLKDVTSAKEYQAIKDEIGRHKAAMNDITADFMSSIFGDKANFAGSAIEQTIKQMQDVADKHPIHVDVKTELPKVKASLQDITSIIAELGSSISGLGQALEMPALDVAGVMAQAIASLILGYAEATKLAGILGPWAWISFGALGLAQLTSIIATVKSLGAYANGGIVGGSSYAGDRLYARVNSGEMILNGNQQQHLFNMINNGGGSAASTGEVQFVIKGSDLYGTLKNYNSKMGKVR